MKDITKFRLLIALLSMLILGIGWFTAGAVSSTYISYIVGAISGGLSVSLSLWILISFIDL